MDNPKDATAAPACTDTEYWQKFLAQKKLQPVEEVKVQQCQTQRLAGLRIYLQNVFVTTALTFVCVFLLCLVHQLVRGPLTEQSENASNAAKVALLVSLIVFGINKLCL